MHDDLSRKDQSIKDQNIKDQNTKDQSAKDQNRTDQSTNNQNNQSHSISNQVHTNSSGQNETVQFPQTQQKSEEHFGHHHVEKKEAYRYFTLKEFVLGILLGFGVGFVLSKLIWDLWR